MKKPTDSTRAARDEAERLVGSARGEAAKVANKARVEADRVREEITGARERHDEEIASHQVLETTILGQPLDPSPCLPVGGGTTSLGPQRLSALLTHGRCPFALSELSQPRRHPNQTCARASTDFAATAPPRSPLLCPRSLLVAPSQRSPSRTHKTKPHTPLAFPAEREVVGG